METPVHQQICHGVSNISQEADAGGEVLILVASDDDSGEDEEEEHRHVDDDRKREPDTETTSDNEEERHESAEPAWLLLPQQYQTIDNLKKHMMNNETKNVVNKPL